MKQNTKFTIIAIISIIIFAIAITPVTLQNDTYYTIKIGEHILQTGQIDMKDPFSWHSDLSYTYPHWLYDVITYMVYHFSGFAGIYISTIVLAAILGITLYITNVKLTKNRAIPFFVTIISMYLLRDFIAARAQLITFVLFILTIYFIERFLETRKKRYVIGLVIIPILIVNLHTAVFPFYFVLYLPYIGEYIISNFTNVIVFFKKVEIRKYKKKLMKMTEEEKKEKLNNKIVKLEENNKKCIEDQIKLREKSYKINIVTEKNMKWIIVIFLICTLTGFITPIGTTPYTYLIKTIQGETTQNISEHLPLTLANNIEFMSLLAVYLGILTFTDTKIRLKYGFLLLGMLLLAFNSRRQVSLFILICSYALSQMITVFINKYESKLPHNIEKYFTTMFGKITVISIMLIISILLFKPKIGNQFVSDSSYPVAAAQYIKNNLDVKNMKIYNEYNYGSYLLYNDIPVFIDSRADLYTAEFNEGKDIFSDFMDISNQNIYYEEKFEEYKITHVMTTKKSRLNIYISRDSHYQKLYEDNYFVIYARNRTV